MPIRASAVLLTAAVILAVDPLAAQVVRESDASSVAGVLGGSEAKTYDEFTFISNGDEILYATVDAAIYQTQGATSHEAPGEELPAMPGEEPGGCEDEEAVGLCLQVLDAYDEVVCWATRPRNPGWQRDPRLICLLPAVRGKPASYRLRLALADDDCSDLLYPVPATGDNVPYLLNVSLRRVAGSGGLAPAIARSTNRY